MKEGEARLARRAMTRRQCAHGRRTDRCRACGKGYCFEHGRPAGVLRQHCQVCRVLRHGAGRAPAAKWRPAGRRRPSARLEEALAVVRDCLMQAPDVQKCVLTLRTGTTLVLDLAP